MVFRPLEHLLYITRVYIFPVFTSSRREGNMNELLEIFKTLVENMGWVAAIYAIYVADKNGFKTLKLHWFKKFKLEIRR